MIFVALTEKIVSKWNTQQDVTKENKNNISFIETMKTFSKIKLSSTTMRRTWPLLPSRTKVTQYLLVGHATQEMK
jgi:hypothetical protein